MLASINHDAFLFGGGFFEGFSGGYWHTEDLTREELETGLMFPAFSSLPWAVFMQSDKNATYAVTHIDSVGVMRSYRDLAYQEVISKVQEIITDLHNNDLQNIGIYKMSDGMSFLEYVSKSA